MAAARRRRGQAFRPGTRANQCSHALLYVAFCIYFGFTDFPAATSTLLIFAEFLLRSYTATKSVTNALSSLHTFHRVHGFPSAGFLDFQLTLWRRALPLTSRNAPMPAPALTLPGLVTLCRLALQRGDKGLSFAALLATAFYWLARLSSLVLPAGGRPDPTRTPLLGDLVLEPTRALLLIKWGKTAQDAASAFWVPLPTVGGSPACPVALLAALRARLSNYGTQLPLFSYPSGQVGGRPISFDVVSARSMLRLLLAQAGWQHQAFTFHSLRRGGCTLAFSSGAALSDLQLLGGWRSRAIDAYYPHLEARGRAAAALARGSSRLLSRTRTTFPPPLN